LRITKHRKSKYVALDVYINPNDWNKLRCRVKTNTTNAAYVNNYLAVKIAEAESVSLEMEAKSKTITAYDIKSRILGKAPSDFFSFVVKREEITNNEYSIGIKLPPKAKEILGFYRQLAETKRVVEELTLHHSYSRY
jgi:hypothetical protein